jgi:hypothetical protein
MWSTLITDYSVAERAAQSTQLPRWKCASRATRETPYLSPDTMLMPFSSSFLPALFSLFSVLDVYLYMCIFPPVRGFSCILSSVHVTIYCGLWPPGNTICLFLTIACSGSSSYTIFFLKRGKRLAIFINREEVTLLFCLRLTNLLPRERACSPVA